MRISDWSSDVCSSDVGDRDGMVALRPGGELPLKGAAFLASPIVDAVGQQDGGTGIRFFLRETWPGRDGGVEHVSFSRECGRGCRPRFRLAIGSASGRERGCQYVYISVSA